MKELIKILKTQLAEFESDFSYLEEIMGLESKNDKLIFEHFDF